MLIALQLVAAPFQVGLLTTAPPWAFLCHIGGYLVGEMWLGVCVAIVIELVPRDLSASAVAVYFFIIQIIGGNMPLFVTPLTNALDYRWALLILYPGMYVAAAMLFIVTLLMVACKDSRISETEYDMTKQVPIDDDAVVVESDDGTFKSKSELVANEAYESLDMQEKPRDDSGVFVVGSQYTTLRDV